MFRPISESSAPLAQVLLCDGELNGDQYQTWLKRSVLHLSSTAHYSDCESVLNIKATCTNIVKPSISKISKRRKEVKNIILNHQLLINTIDGRRTRESNYSTTCTSIQTTSEQVEDKTRASIKEEYKEAKERNRNNMWSSIRNLECESTSESNYESLPQHSTSNERSTHSVKRILIFD